MNHHRSASWSPERSVTPCLLCSVEEEEEEEEKENGGLLVRSVTTGNLIWLNTCKSRLLRMNSSHHQCCTLCASAIFFILHPNPPLVPLDESSQCVPTLPRVSKFSLVLILRLCCCAVIPGDTCNTVHLHLCFHPLKKRCCL